MTRLDVTDGFDVHEYRHGPKLRKEDRDQMHLANRNEFEVPPAASPSTASSSRSDGRTPSGSPTAPLRGPDRRGVAVADPLSDSTD